MEEIRDIIIDDGVQTYRIKNQRGQEIGTFDINPADLDMVRRFEEVAAYLDGLSVELEKEDAEKAFEKATEEIKEKFDYLFKADVSKSFFAVMNPFTPLASGEFFIENVIDAIGKVVQEVFKVRTRKVNARVNKYTDKYQQPNYHRNYNSRDKRRK